MQEEKQNINTSKKHSVIKKLDGSLLKEMVSGGAEELRSNIEKINNLNVFPVPDGDTGDNMFSTVNSGVKAIEKLETDNLAEVMRVLSHGMLLGARGNSGVILSQFFKGVADGFENSKSADPKELGKALELGVKEAYATVTTPTEGTILTVARESVEYAVSKINPKTTIRSFFNDLVKELHASVERTPELLPALKEAGVVDSGGAGLFYLMDGFNRVLKGEKIENKTSPENNQSTYENLAKDSSHFEKQNSISERSENKKDKVFCNNTLFDENSKMKFAYCTELLVQLMRAKCDTDSFNLNDLRDFLSSSGDSVATVKSGSVIKIHTHTFYPDKILAYMLQFGEFINVKIENMSLQHSDIADKFEKNAHLSKQTFANDNIQEKNHSQSYYEYKPSSENCKEENQENNEESKNDKNGIFQKDKHFPKTQINEEIKPAEKRKKYGIVAVSSGDGIDRLFRELGADETIITSEKNTPSAYDFYESAKRTDSEEVFIFPNNANFILSAEQAAKMESSFKIHVIPSKNIALGYAALSVINVECGSSEEIIRSANKAMNNAITGYIFTAARDSRCSGIKIKCGDCVGAIGKDIVIKSKTRVECATKICKRIMQEKYVLTIFSGKGALETDTLLIEKKIKKSRPDAEIYVIDSGQEIFEYIFSAE